MKSPSSTPWKMPFKERLDQLFYAKDKKLVLCLAETNCSSFRYRIYNVVQTLKNSTVYTASYFYIDEIENLKETLNHISIIVISRIQWSFKIQEFLELAKSKNVTLVYDIDDLIFDPKQICTLMNSLGIAEYPKDYDFWFSKSSRHWLLASYCDATIGTNTFICQKLKSCFNKNSYEIPNFLNEEQLNVTKLLSSKKNPGFKIGYFSGSPTHANDFKVCVAEIMQFLDMYRDATLTVVGYMNFPNICKDAIKRKQIIQKPLVDFLSLPALIHDVDVNIVPLIENDFTNCKSELKFYEAAIVDTVTLASPTYAFKTNIEQGKTGFLCNPGDWFTTLVAIYKKQVDPEIAKNAKEYCLKKYSPQNQLAPIENTLTAILS